MAFSIQIFFRLDNLNTHTKKSHGMGYKDAESVTGISATSTTKITIVPPQNDITGIYRQTCVKFILRKRFYELNSNTWLSAGKNDC